MGRILVGVASAAAGYTCWHYVFAPLPDVSVSNHTAQAVAEFMEANKLYWGTDGTTFADVPSHLARIVDYPRPTDGPHFNVSRLMKSYDGVPCLRSTAFFPNVTVDEVACRMIDPEKRKKWDRNYKFFEEFVTFPVPKKIQQMREGFVAKSRQWCGHVIASATLEKVGVQPRSFIYERIVAEREDGAVCITYRSLDGSEPEKVDGRKNAPSALGLAALVATPAAQDTKDPPKQATTFAAALVEKFHEGPAKGSQDVKMLWQEVLLLPVRRRDIDIQSFEARKDMNAQNNFPNPTGVTSTLFALAYEFFKEGNPFTSGLDRVLWAPPGSERRLDPKKYEVVGTLMVMTSCNDAKVRPVPRLMQKYVAKYLTNNTFEMLLTDIADGKKIQKTVPKAAQK
jgi:hypothetical protein